MCIRDSSSSFPLFPSCQVFRSMSWHGLLNVVLSQIFFLLNTLFSYLQICSFSVLSFCHTDQECLQWPTFFFLLTMFANDLTGCFSYAALKVVITESMSASLFFVMVRGANFPPIIAWKVSNTLGTVSFSRSNLSLVCFGLLILFRRRWKVIIIKSWSLPMSAPGKLRVLALFTPDRKRFLTSLECNQSGRGVVHLGYATSIF